MVALDSHFEHLTAAQKAGWKTPKENPDIDPAHEALQIVEQFRELLRQPAVLEKPDAFRGHLRAGETAAAALESLLRDARGPKQASHTATEKAFQSLGAACAACHEKYRD